MATSQIQTKNASQDENVFIGALWMFGITLILFFLPVINGLIGGAVGGYKIGSPGRAVTAAILPAILTAGGLWLLLVVLDLPIIGIIAGFATGVLILLSNLGILAGALIGGTLRNAA